MTDTAQLRLSAHLAEYTRLAGENQTTFQRQQQQVNAMVLLSGAIVGFIAHDPKVIQDYPLIIVALPLPFLFLTALHLRDDLKIQATDEFVWRIIRPRVLSITRYACDEAWNWLQAADNFKFGTGGRHIYRFLSLGRYALPAAAILTPLVANAYWFMDLRLGVPWTGNLLSTLIVYLTSPLFLRDVLFYLDLVAFALLFGGGWWAVRKGGAFLQPDNEGWMTAGLAVRVAEAEVDGRNTDAGAQ